MKRNIYGISALLILCLLVVSGCATGDKDKKSISVNNKQSSENYSEIKETMLSMSGSMDIFYKRINAASSADEVVMAMNTLARDFKVIRAKITKLKKKYPELKRKKNPPTELKSAMKIFEKSMKKMRSLRAKILSYNNNNPRVKKAQRNMLSALTGRE